MPELTIEALQHFMIENGCKVKSTDAIEFFRNNFINSVSDVGKNKDLFKQYMEELTTAQLAENGDRYLVLKRKHMVYSPYNSSARIGDRSTTIGHKAHIVSPRVKRSHSEHRPISPRTHTSPKVSELPQSLPNVMNSKSRDIPASLLDVAIIPYGQIETDGGCTLQEDGGFETEESGDDLSDMELGSVGGCSHNQLEPNQKEWIYKTAIGDLDSVTRLLLQDTEKSLVKYKDFISGYTGLHWACKLSRVDMVHVLLTAGSDVNSKAFNGMTPLHLAAQGGSDVIIDILLDNNADRFTRDYNGKYPVYYMSGKCSPKTRELLTPPVVSQQKPRYMMHFSEHNPHFLSNKQDSKTSFTLRRHKREKSDASERSKTLTNNFKYQNLSKASNKRPLSGLRIDHISLDMNGSEGVTMVKSKEEALESVSSPTLSPRSVKRRSLSTPLNSHYDNEPLLHHKPNVVIEEPAFVKTNDSKRPAWLCCCPNRKRQSSV